jgi:hypothetical protein
MRKKQPLQGPHRKEEWNIENWEKTTSSSDLTDGMREMRITLIPDYTLFDPED